MPVLRKGGRQGPQLTLEEQLWASMANALAVAVGQDPDAELERQRASYWTLGAQPEISLSDYCKQAWHLIEPGESMKWNWHHEAKCEHLQAVSMGQIKRLVLNEPPRHGKSSIAAVLWPSWEWHYLPWSRWISSSFVDTLATRDTVRARRIMLSGWYRKRWGHVFTMTGDQNQKTRYENDKTGFRIGTSVGASIIGEGGDRILVDDALDPRGMVNDNERERVNEYFTRTLSTRKSNPERTAIVVVAQRLHARDLPGILMEMGGWEKLVLPTEYEPPVAVMVPDWPSGNGDTRTNGHSAPTTPPQTVADQYRGTSEHIKMITPPKHRTVLGFEDPRTKPGELLWPDMYGPVAVADEKRILGSFGFAAQHQQRPAPAEGGVYKKVYWRFWKPQHSRLPQVLVPIPGTPGHLAITVEIPHRLDAEIQAWDLTFDGSVSYDVGQVWGRKGADVFLLDQVRAQMDFVKQIEAVQRLSKDWPDATTKLVEYKANAAALISTLRSKVPGLIPREPEGDKVGRGVATSVYAESGNVYLPHPAMAPWVWDFIENFNVFPNGPTDEIDAYSLAMRRLFGKGNVPEPGKWSNTQR